MGGCTEPSSTCCRPSYVKLGYSRDKSKCLRRFILFLLLNFAMVLIVLIGYIQTGYWAPSANEQILRRRSPVEIKEWPSSRKGDSVPVALCHFNLSSVSAIFIPFHY